MSLRNDNDTQDFWRFCMSEAEGPTASTPGSISPGQGNAQGAAED